MIKVSFDPSTLTGDRRAEWDRWQARADAATLELIGEWETWLARKGRQASDRFEFDWKQKIWSELKTWLKDNVFHDKCAYCEALFGQFLGDAEHYRPKGRISVLQNGVLVRVSIGVDGTGIQIASPGYFWLAYDWRNLLPSCQSCNTMQGKADQFPVERTLTYPRKFSASELKALVEEPYESAKRPGWYYPRSLDLNILEKPMLLHPYFDEPHKHLRFGYGGCEAAIDGSPRGLATIQICDLGNAKVRRLRQSQQEKILTSWGTALSYFVKQPTDIAVKGAQAAVDDFVRGVEPHSAAALDMLREWYPNCGLTHPNRNA
jgi:hypothetical protein